MTTPSITPAQLAALQTMASAVTTAAKAATSAATAATATASTLTAVVAKIAANTSPPPVTTPPTTKPAVTGLTVVAGVQGQLLASWTNPTPAPTSVTVARDGAEANGTSPNWSTVATGAPTAQEFDNLADATTYTITITPNGGSPVSVKGTTIPAPVVTPPPVTVPGSTLPFSTGVWLTGNGTDYADYDKWLGHPTVFADAFQYRPDEATMCSMSASAGPIGGGKIPIASFQCIISGGSETRNGISAATVQHRAALAGANLKAMGPLGAKAVIRIMTEANNGSSGDAPCNVWDAQSVADYAKCFHAATLGFRSVAGTQFTLLADVSFDAGNNADLRIMLDAVKADADGMGGDIYNAAVPWGSAYTNETDQWSKRLTGVNGGIGYGAYVQWCIDNDKWLFIPENGLGYFYSNNGAAQTPPDANSVFYEQLFAVLSNPELKVGGVCAWEDNNGLYLTGGQSLPNSTAAFRATNGSLPSAPWPRP